MFGAAKGQKPTRRPAWVAAFVEALEAQGWKVGRNLLIDYRFDIFDDARAQSAIAELLKLSPDLILAHSVVATRAAQQATHTVPIVFTHISEPIAQGFTSRLVHPGQHHRFLELGAERGH